MTRKTLVTPTETDLFFQKDTALIVLYNVLVDLGLYTKEELWSEYNQIHGRFGMHPNYLYLPGIDASTGSLGQGMALAVGMALAGRIDKKRL